MAGLAIAIHPRWQGSRPFWLCEVCSGQSCIAHANQRPVCKYFCAACCMGRKDTQPPPPPSQQQHPHNHPQFSSTDRLNPGLPTSFTHNQPTLNSNCFPAPGYGHLLLVAPSSVATLLDGAAGAWRVAIRGDAADVEVASSRPRAMPVASPFASRTALQQSCRCCTRSCPSPPSTPRSSPPVICAQGALTKANDILL